MIILKQISKFDKMLQADMAVHYSKPKGFVGRSICYSVTYEDIKYGHIIGGSSTRFLPGRNEFFSKFGEFSLEEIVNNIFFHIEPKPLYPVRNFSQKVLKQFRWQIQSDWFNKYGDKVKGFESLVELPRKGEVYLRDGWQLVGQTKGFTCKREGGKGTDSWSGKRVWNTTDLKPKLVFCRW